MKSAEEGHFFREFLAPKPTNMGGTWPYRQAGPSRAFRGPGNKLRNDAHYQRSEQRLFRSRPLDWLKTHFRAIPAVKMLKIFNFETLYALRPWGKSPHLPLSRRPCHQHVIDSGVECSLYCKFHLNKKDGLTRRAWENKQQCKAFAAKFSWTWTTELWFENQSAWFAWSFWCIQKYPTRLWCLVEIMTP